jgi:hypothetical protein
LKRKKKLGGEVLRTAREDSYILGRMRREEYRTAYREANRKREF